MGAVLLGVYYALFVRYHVSTDDAYVNSNLVRLTPQISGTVVAINTDETQVAAPPPCISRRPQSSRWPAAVAA